MIIRLQNITKQYRHHFWSPLVTAVNKLDFEIGSNEVVGFVGPNGAGKTTTIKMIMGLLHPTKGTIAVNGFPPDDRRSRTEIAFLTEQPYLYEHLTVAESITFMARLKGLGGDSLKKESARVLELVDLAGVTDRRVRQLSKGMQQRLSLAQALLGDPPLCIFDEPMSGMDPPGRTLFRQIFMDLHRRGKTIFFSTHILDDIERLCTRVIVLSRGAKTFDGPISQLLDQGYEGTELVVENLPENLVGRIQALGATVESIGSSATTVFVPRDRDATAVQTLLAQNSIYCLSIGRRSKSMETLLYTTSKQ